MGSFDIYLYYNFDLGDPGAYFKSKLFLVAKGKSPGTEIDRNVSELRVFFVHFIAPPQDNPG